VERVNPSPVLMLDDLTSDTTDKTVHSIAHRVIRLEEVGLLLDRMKAVNLDLEPHREAGRHDQQAQLQAEIEKLLDIA
jgi:hypothetical protein